MQVLNLKNANSLYKGNKEVLKLYKGNNLLYEKLEEIKKYYYTRDSSSSYINFFSEDFKDKGSIKLPDVLLYCTIEYDFIYNCFVGYKITGKPNTKLKVVYFTIDILNKTLNISMKNEGLNNNCYYSGIYYIGGGLFKFRGTQEIYSGYRHNYRYMLFNPYDSNYVTIFSEYQDSDSKYDYKENIERTSLNIEKNTNKLVISTYGTNLNYDSNKLYLRLIINKNKDKIEVEWKNDENDSNYDYYWRYTDDNNIALRFDYERNYYYNSEKTLYNYVGGKTIGSKNITECRMIKNNKYYFLNNYNSSSSIDVIDYPITENKYKASINCESDSCTIPFILNNEIYSSNFYDKIVKYNKERSEFYLINNFIDFGTTSPQKFLCFI